jgi:hypothetical protein
MAKKRSPKRVSAPKRRSLKPDPKRLKQSLRGPEGLLDAESYSRSFPPRHHTIGPSSFPKKGH